jgi:hypothetical protein
MDQGPHPGPLEPSRTAPDGPFIQSNSVFTSQTRPLHRQNGPSLNATHAQTLDFGNLVSLLRSEPISVLLLRRYTF